MVNRKVKFENKEKIKSLKWPSVDRYNRYRDYTKLDHIPNGIFSTFPVLELLEINDHDIRVLHRNNFAGATQLQTLDLSYNKIDGIPDNCFDGLVSLREVWMSGNQIHKLNRLTFAGAPNIESLRFGFNQIDNIEEGALNLPNFRILNLMRNKLRMLNDSILNGAHKLERVVLSNNVLTHIGHAFSSCHQLVELELQGNDIRDINFTSFANLKRLESLSLYANRGYKFQDEIPSSPVTISKLKKLDLSYSRLSNPDIIKHLAIFPQLEELNLRMNQFTILNDVDKIKDFFPKLTKICRDDGIRNLQLWTNCW